MSGFPAWGSGNGRRSPQRIWLWRPAGFDHRNSTQLGETETPLLEGAHKVSCAPGPRGKKQWPHKRLGQTYLLILEGLLWRWRVAVAHCRDKDTGSSNSGEYSLVWVHLEAATSSPRPIPSQQCWDASGQTANRAGTQPHPSADRLLKVFLSTALPTRGTRPSSTYQWAGTSPSYQEACTSLLDSFIHQRADSRSKKNYHLAACGKETAITES